MHKACGWLLREAGSGGRLIVGNANGLRVVPLVEGSKQIELTGCGRAGSGPVLLLATSGALPFDSAFALFHQVLDGVGHAPALMATDQIEVVRDFLLAP